MKQMHWVTLAAIAFFCAGSAQAQPYPSRPITEIVPFAAGGPTDVIARITGEYMSKVLGQQIVIENVKGAGGTTGIARGAQAKADGYSIMMGHMGTHGAAPALYPKLKYDPTRDFEPIGLVVGTPILVVAKKDFPAKDLKEFMAYVKANQSKLNEAHAGVGSVSFTACSLFDSQLGIKPARVAYPGTGPALNDLMGGQVDFMCDQIVSVAEQIKGGKIRAYAIATAQRSPALPNLPTAKEAGLPQFEASAWNALFAPKGTPRDIGVQINAAVGKGIEDPTARERFSKLGAEPPTAADRSPEALGKIHAADVAKWGKVIRDAKVTVN